MGQIIYYTYCSLSIRYLVLVRLLSASQLREVRSRAISNEDYKSTILTYATSSLEQMQSGRGSKMCVKLCPTHTHFLPCPQHTQMWHLQWHIGLQNIYGVITHITCPTCCGNSANLNYTGSQKNVALPFVRRYRSGPNYFVCRSIFLQLTWYKHGPKTKRKKIRGLSPRATAACRRS
jgi:hypothetical protein